MTGKLSDDGIRFMEKDLPQRFILKILGHCETTGLWGLRHTREPVDKMVKFAKNHKLCLPIVQLIVTREGLFVLPLDYKKKLKSERSATDPELKINVTIPRSEIKCVRSDKDESKVSGHCLRIKAHFRIVKHIDRGRSKVKKKIEDIFPEKRKGEICKGCGREQARHEEPLRAVTDAELLEKYKKIDWKSNGITFYPIDSISYGVQDLVYTRVFSMIEVADVRSRFGAGGVPFVCHSFVCDTHNTAKLLTYALDAAFQAYGKTLKGSAR